MFTESLLQELGLHDKGRRLKHLKDANQVAVPMLSTLSEKDLGDHLREKIGCGTEFEIKRMNLPKAKSLSVQKPEVVLREALKKLVESKGYEWTPELSADVPKHWEIHGDMVLIPSTSLNLQLWHKLGDDLWPVITRCLSGTRLARKSVVHTDGFRSPRVELLLGTSGWVEQVDNGIRYTYDITKCMFSSGNISEKLRVASFDCAGEVVVDLYAGIGYFTLPYLVHAGAKHLHACEWNPDAVEALQRNLEMNGVQDRCTIHAGDNKQVCPRGVADRVNLGLIPSSREGWLPACQALKADSCGTLHIHYNVNTKPLAAENQRCKFTEKSAGNRGCSKGNQTCSSSGNHCCNSNGNQTCCSTEKYTSKSREPEEMFRREAKCTRREFSNFDEGNGDLLSKRNGESFEQNVKSNTTEVIQHSNEKLSCQSCKNTVHSPVELHSSLDDFDSEIENMCLLTIDNHFTEKAPDFHKRDNFVNENDMDTRNSNVNKYDIGKCKSTKDHLGTTRDFVETTSHGSEANRNIHGHTDQGLCPKPCLTPTGVRHGFAQIHQNGKQSSIAKTVLNSKWFPWAQEVAIDIKNLLETVHRGTWSTEILHIEHVKSYAPFVDHVVLDLRCKPLNVVTD